MGTAPRDPQTDEIIRRFSECIRYESENCLFVRGEKTDHLLETDLVYVHPEIPSLALAHVKNRLGLVPGIDGVFLCVILDTRTDVPMELCVLTTQGVRWWENDVRRACRIDYAEIADVLSLTMETRRGLKIIRQKTGAATITLSLHDALLMALAQFLKGIHETPASHKGPLDLNLATVEQIAALPLMNPEKARHLVARREELQGFRHISQVGQVLEMHPQEFIAFSEHVTLHPYRSPYRQGRRVDY